LISFERVALSSGEPSPPRRTRFQLAFWPGLALSVDARPAPKRKSQAQRFREWLGRDPQTVEPEHRWILVEDFIACHRRRRWSYRHQGDLFRKPCKISKPKSLGRRASKAERADWEVPLRLPIYPATRGDCMDKTRPCVRYLCRYNLRFDVNLETGIPKDLYPGVDPDNAADTCALDVAERGGHTLQELGDLMSIVLEHARYEERQAILEFTAKWNAFFNSGPYEEFEEEEIMRARLAFVGYMSRLRAPRNTARARTLVIEDLDPPAAEADASDDAEEREESLEEYLTRTRKGGGDV
jgi:hypothetical protein